MKIVFLTGAGMSVESGLTTFRDAGGLWENYPVMEVASHDGWLRNPEKVNAFYNMLRMKYRDVKPCRGHRLITTLEEKHDVTVVTQNVDNLHEMAGSKHVIHLHGELMRMCSSRDVDNPRFWVSLPKDGWGEYGLEVPKGTKADDGSLLRPYIVFFQENVPNIYDGIEATQKADIFVIIGTSLNVYPAASLLQYAPKDARVFLIDPHPALGNTSHNVHIIAKGASEGMEELLALLAKES